MFLRRAKNSRAERIDSDSGAGLVSFLTTGREERDGREGRAEGLREPGERLNLRDEMRDSEMRRGSESGLISPRAARAALVRRACPLCLLRPLLCHQEGKFPRVGCRAGACLSSRVAPLAGKVRARNIWKARSRSRSRSCSLRGAKRQSRLAAGYPFSLFFSFFPSHSFFLSLSLLIERTHQYVYLMP